MATWAKALKKKDLVAMHKDYAADYRLFDVGATADGVEATKDLWEQCFPFFDDPEIEYKDVKIAAGDDLAFVHFYSRIHGLNVPVEGDIAKSWLRGTVCFRKEGRRWLCAHEHISLPMNCETGEISYIIDDADRAA